MELKKKMIIIVSIIIIKLGIIRYYNIIDKRITIQSN